MKKHKILYIPLDERPCNYLFPSNIVSCRQDIELIKPEMRIMSKKSKQPILMKSGNLLKII